MKQIFAGVILLIIAANSLWAQQVEFGIKSSSFVICSKEYEENKTKTYFPISGLSFFLDIDISEKLSFVIQPGYSFPTEEFSGVSLDAYLNRYIIEKRLSIFGGVGIHINSEKHHGGDPITFIENKAIFLLNVGASYYFQNSFMCDIQFALPVNGEIGYDGIDSGGPSGLEPGLYEKELKFLIKFSVGYKL